MKIARAAVGLHPARAHLIQRGQQQVVDGSEVVEDKRLAIPGTAGNLARARAGKPGLAQGLDSGGDERRPDLG
jgi:hypothetical protein